MRIAFGIAQSSEVYLSLNGDSSLTRQELARALKLLDAELDILKKLEKPIRLLAADRKAAREGKRNEGDLAKNLRKHARRLLDMGRERISKLGKKPLMTVRRIAALEARKERLNKYLEKSKTKKTVKKPVEHKKKQERPTVVKKTPTPKPAKSTKPAVKKRLK